MRRVLCKENSKFLKMNYFSFLSKAPKIENLFCSKNRKENITILLFIMTKFKVHIWSFIFSLNLATLISFSISVFFFEK